MSRSTAPSRANTRSRGRLPALLAALACLVATLAVPVAADGAPPGPVPDDPGRSREPGRWSVQRDPSGVRLVWRSPGPLPVTDARPEFRLDGQVLGHPSLDERGRSLSLELGPRPAIDADDVQVWLGPRRLDAPAGRAAAPLPHAGEALRQLVDSAVPPQDDPGEPGPLAVRSFSYTADSLPWKGFSEPLEMLGEAVLPRGVSNAPVVVFLHGRHYYCYGEGDTGDWPCSGRSKPVPSHLGYRYLQRLLASQGYATVSISANAINAQDWRSADGGARARAALVRHHLELLAQWSRDPGNRRWYGRLDLDQVVLVGHSRGGEGVNQAAVEAAATRSYRLRGQVLLAPTDFGYQTAGYLPTQVVLPYCDGDVSDLQGQRFVDAAPVLAPDDPALRSSVLLLGANHNFFNTEWTPGRSVAPSFDDWFDPTDPVCGRRASPTRLSAAEQRRAAKTLVAAGVHAFLARDTRQALAWLDSGDPVALPEAGPAVALTGALGGRRRTARLGSGPVVTGRATPCRAGYVYRPEPVRPLCGLSRDYRQPHWTRAATVGVTPQAAYTAAGLPGVTRLAWAGPGVRGGLALPVPVDLSRAGTTLDLRVVADPTKPAARFRVVLGSGGRRWAGPVRTLTPLPGRSWLATLWGQTVRVDPDDFAGHVNLRRVDRVLLESVSPSGRVWVLDVSRRLPGLAAVPDRSLPRLRLGRVAQPEGSRNGIARLPFRVLGDVRAPARFAVAVDLLSFGDGRRPRYDVVAVSPGQRTGTIAVPYQGDRRDDLAVQAQQVVAVPLRGITSSDYHGAVVIADDDPAPTVTLRPARSRIGYGDEAVFEIALSAPVDYYIPNRVRAVRVPGLRPLRTSDVPVSWLRDHIGEVPPDVPLAGVWTWDAVHLPPGATRATVSVPTRSRPLHPTTKWLTTQFFSSQLQQRARATVRVDPSSR